MAHFRRIVEDRAGPILLIGRLLLAWLFVHEGLTSRRQPRRRA